MTAWLGKRRLSILEVPIRPSRQIPALLLLGALLGCEHRSQPSTPSSPPPVAIATPAPTPTPQPANRPPTATIFDWQPRTTAVVGGTHVGFGARGSDPDDDPLSFKWDFGDGTTDSGEALFHIFQQAGNFNVRLTVSDGRGGTDHDDVLVRARRIEGEWTVVNALHIPMTAIQQWPESSFFAGRMSDRSTFEGRLLDPYGIRMEYSTADDRCLVSGTYEGSISSSINEIVFEGRGCRNIRFLR